MMRQKLVPGYRHEMLTVVDGNFTCKDKPRRVLCRCDCGNLVWLSNTELVPSCGRKSCGCFGASLNNLSVLESATYQSWRGMINRCNNPKDASYKDYGGRGIRICERWGQDFRAFLADMGPRQPGMSIERLDVDGHYEPNNCTWIPKARQRDNLRSSLRKCMKQAGVQYDETLSRQRNTQILHQATGICLYCSYEVFRAHRCRKHWEVMHAQYQKKLEAGVNSHHLS